MFNNMKTISKKKVFSADARQENDEPEDSTIEEDSHDGHVSFYKDK